ncbi:MAG TPA: type I methionyl aminopeptidase [candidate division WOR-3 bacterium]|uniref:Methionine aminopeptidase n=1 Tax=candidate division WOR-3 bacterium TaxID=2052148 RepID=A0A7V0T714_UNCW3|nr:type I methionyl aminopeptidase [candidate division WOR-3 bacterium]
MRAAGRILCRTLNLAAAAIAPGVMTRELDVLCEREIRSAGAVPTFLGYQGYPAATCISVNDEVVHGIPSDRQLREGDICKIDLGVTLDGMVADAARTWPVGRIRPETGDLLRATEEALARGVAQCRAGRRVGDVGHAIQSWVEARGFSVVRALCGHGVGRELHEEPQVPNYGRAGRGVRLEAGMTLAVEPMVNIGRHDVRILDDGWTVVTRDGLPSAHFEHTILVTDEEAEVLTANGKG